MERKILIDEKASEKIQLMSEELKKVGLGEFANCYYEDDDYDCPYFKIVKPFEKENDSDPNAEIIFIDVTHEYTVHARLGHDHYENPSLVAQETKGLFDGTLAEVALCFSSFTARVLISNTKEPSTNVAVLGDNANKLMEIVNGVLPSLSDSAHVHHIFSPTYPHYLQVLLKQNPTISGCQIYLQSIVIGKHPEIFLT